MQVELSVKNKKANVRQLVINRTVVFGRGRNVAIRLTHDQISRAHCRLILDEADVKLEDLGSSNGTFVNGHRLEKGKPQAVTEGDTIALGPIFFEISMIDLQPPRTPTAPELFDAMTMSDETVASDPDNDTVATPHDHVVASAATGSESESDAEDEQAVLQADSGSSAQIIEQDQELEDDILDESFDAFSDEPDDDFAAVFDDAMSDGHDQDEQLVLTEDEVLDQDDEQITAQDDKSSVEHISQDDILDILGGDDDEEIHAGVSSDADIQTLSDDNDLQNFLKNL